MQGLEEVLAEELKDLGGKDIQILRRAVSCDGDYELVYKINYLSRVAIRVLIPILKFYARNEKDFYYRAMDYKWVQHLSSSNTFAISSTVNSSYFTHSHYVALKLKDAICDHFRKKMGRRPSIDTEQPDLKFDLQISGDNVNISIDSTGDSLHLRGYRIQGHQAPLNEVLAAGMVLLSGWDKKSPFIDFMCGSGTIPLEASMIANNIPAGIRRTNYAFKNWPNFDNGLWRRIQKQAKANIVENEVEIIANDIDPDAKEIARQTFLSFNFARSIELSNEDFKELKDLPEGSTIVINPPYGERIGEEDDMDLLYQEIGDFLKQNCKGSTAWIISSNFEAMKKIGLKASKKLVLFNGPLECKFHQIELF